MLAFIDTYDVWVMLAGVFGNVACALVGCYLVLRRLALLGDAISHAVLPGPALAFIITGSRDVLPMFIGALIVGVATTFLTQALHQWGKVPEDSSMGVVFTSLFAVGVLMITYVASQVDLDPGCVLYGSIEATPDTPLVIAGRQTVIPRQVAVLGAVLLLNLLGILIFYKELKIVAFDPFLATTLGFSAGVVHYGLMTAVAVTSVASFESVGSILVVAMLITPAATAQLLTDRLDRMLLIAALVAAVSGVAGYLVAAYGINSPAAPMMAVVAGIQFAAAVLAAPRYGLISKKLHQFSLAARIVREDILGMLYRWQEARPSEALRRDQVVAAVGGGFLPRLALRLLTRRGDVVIAASGDVTLTPTGRTSARRLVRAHRLWESYLGKHFGLPLDHLHEPAMRMEHYVGDNLQSSIEAEVAGASDPHGREIPSDP
jgi:manganese/zinc/iron transport system permease protein